MIEASGVIEEAGFTVIDDILHGYGGGYFPPILGTKSRPGGPVPEEPFEAGMMVVVQPNVVTRDGKAGVQTGEMPADHQRRHRADARLSARLCAGVADSRDTQVTLVMPALVAGIHPLIAIRIEDVDGRDKPGHDADSGYHCGGHCAYTAFSCSTSQSAARGRHS